MVSHEIGIQYMFQEAKFHLPGTIPINSNGIRKLIFGEAFTKDIVKCSNYT